MITPRKAQAKKKIMKEKQSPPANKRVAQKHDKKGFLVLTIALTLFSFCYYILASKINFNLPSLLMSLPKIVADPFLDRDILPSNVKPVHYDLHLQPNFDTFKFSGHANIKYIVL